MAKIPRSPLEHLNDIISKLATEREQKLAAVEANRIKALALVEEGKKLNGELKAIKQREAEWIVARDAIAALDISKTANTAVEEAENAEDGHNAEEAIEDEDEELDASDGSGIVMPLSQDQVSD